MFFCCSCCLTLLEFDLSVHKYNHFSLLSAGLNSFIDFYSIIRTQRNFKIVFASISGGDFQHSCLSIVRYKGFIYEKPIIRKLVKQLSVNDSTQFTIFIGRNFNSTRQKKIINFESTCRVIQKLYLTWIVVYNSV